MKAGGIQVINVEFGCRNHKTKTIITIKNACEIPHNLHLMQIKVLKTEYNNKVSSMHLLSHLHQQCIALQSLPQPHKFSESSSYTGRFHCKTHAIGLFREEKSISLFFFPGKKCLFYLYNSLSVCAPRFISMGFLNSKIHVHLDQIQILYIPHQYCSPKDSWADINVVWGEPFTPWVLK